MQQHEEFNIQWTKQMIENEKENWWILDKEIIASAALLVWQGILRPSDGSPT